MGNFRVSPQYAYTRAGWAHTRQIPSFEITNCVTARHAEKVAIDIITTSLLGKRYDIRDSSCGGAIAHFNIDGEVHEVMVMAVPI